MSCTIEWSVATTPPELGDGWHHSLKFHSRACQKLQHKYESPNGQTFRSLCAAMRFLEDMPIVPKSSIKKAKSSIKKAKSSSSVKASVDPLPLSEYEIQNQNTREITMRDHNTLQSMHKGSVYKCLPMSYA